MVHPSLSDGHLRATWRVPEMVTTDGREARCQLAPGLPSCRVRAFRDQARKKSWYDGSPTGCE